MNLKHFLRLCTTGKPVIRAGCRLYSNRNILKLSERGMFEDIFPDTSADEIINLFNKSPQRVYAGFDPTAESLHIGNLLIVMNLLHWQRSGHDVIALIGGATGLIGDPSHRTTERPELAEALVRSNVESIKDNLQTIFKNHEQFFWREGRLKPVKFVNNLDWYRNINVVEFIRTIGKHLRLGTMLSRTSVKTRLQSETGMNFTEFTYQVFQAYDWLYLLNEYNCRFQIGGNDQMGNMKSGHDLIGRVKNANVYALTLPLITTEGGKKYGKSERNAVWLSPKKSSSFQFYQFFVRTPDSDVEKLLKLYTFLPLREIAEIVAAHKTSPEKREAQKVLAEQVTLLVHGEEGLQAALQASAVLYDRSIESLCKLNAEELVQVFEGASMVDLMPEPGLTAYELAMKANCFKTDHDAMRIINAGGFYINHQKITNVNEAITPGIHVLPNKVTLLRVGKKTYHVVRWFA
ncbi:tyrosine--tRNA ligase, mitochondrial isoform X1 [Orussus abietinus]|uniref:tyrosine--tRNA ligase, mitochondrial isoform X1 n=1 Tax=Orussus abietinus TaxID=222816 RepID=UPI000C715E12|nr:tyrosine--tRNA ligase, mitochondrial isoform X1 [Orussus abietinus]